jgi:tetratricopeptide (TPR) repeat protein
MTYSRADLERAERYVEAAESRIARQRRTIDRDQATGRLSTDGLGLIDESTSEYQQIGSADRDVGLKVTLRLARLAVDLGRFDEAIRALRDALKIDVGNETRAYVYAELGYVYKEQGLFDAALASYRKSLELDPDSEAVRDGIRIVERLM